MTDQRAAELTAACDQAISTGQNLNTPVDFYSPGCPEFRISINKGRYIKDESGNERRVDEQEAEFHFHSSFRLDEKRLMKIGHFQTNDPKIVLAMVNRIKSQANPDVCDSITFQEHYIPMQQRLAQERERTISVRNELDQYLAATKAKDEEIADLKRRLSSAPDKPQAEPKGKVA